MQRIAAAWWVLVVRHGEGMPCPYKYCGGVLNSLTVVQKRFLMIGADEGVLSASSVCLTTARKEMGVSKVAVMRHLVLFGWRYKASSPNP
ncbi:MAG: hypothetical protein SNJ83_14550, partial [Aggregatilineales bacterium]